MADDAPGAARTAGALYLDTADGFGEWDILLSTRAVRDLRQTRRKAPDRFRVYLKKMKCVALLSSRSACSCAPDRELSNGQFSADNQKRLTDRAAGGVPIYEAKMTADSRLVVRRRTYLTPTRVSSRNQYQVDCIPDTRANSEKQCLSFFPGTLSPTDEYHSTSDSRYLHSCPGARLASSSIPRSRL
jgi:hypothetical protein